MENKYLGKIASSVEDIQHDVVNAHTIWAQRNALKRHGYDVTLADMMDLNQASRSKDLGRSLKHGVAYPLAGAALGGVAGHLLGGRSGALLGGAAGYVGGAIGGVIPEAKAVKKDLHDEIRHRVETGFWKKASEENIYLEKIASKWARRAAGTAQGQAMGITSDLNGAGGAKQVGPARMTNKGLLDRIGQNNTQHAVLEGGRSPVMQRGFGGLGSDKVVGKLENTATRASGDALAAKGSGSVLARQTVKAAPKGILSRVGGFIKRNPLVAAGGALAGGIALGKASQPSQPQPQYQYM